MCHQNKIWNCSVLIKQLLRRGENPELAKSNYSNSIYDEAIKEINLGETDGR